jgi:hypothetical protein
MAISQFPDQQFHDLWHTAVNEGNSLAGFARAIGVDKRACERRRDRLKEKGFEFAQFKTAELVPHRVDQSLLKFHEDWTPERCKDSLKELQAAYPTKWITSRFYAHTTGVKDTTWNRYFGTFEEFCRQSGMGRIRQLSQLGKQIAKHVSVDHYREANKRGEWGEKYIRENSKRFKTILGCNDVHDKDCDPFWRRVFVDTARRVQPDVICINGDLFDLPEFGKYTVDPRTFDVTGRIKWVHEFFADLREVCPDAQIDLIEGNHCFRLVRHMSDASPAMMSLLSDLHGMTVADLFGLPKFQVNYVTKADLSAYRVSDVKAEVARNWRIYYDCVLAHHFPDAARRGLPGWSGHHHSHWSKQFYSPIFGPYEWHQVGCGHRRDATYCNGEAWGNGFILWHVDSATKHTNAEYVPVTDMAVVGGRYYHRDITECWNGEQALGLSAA